MQGPKNNLSAQIFQKAYFSLHNLRLKSTYNAYVIIIGASTRI